MSSDRLHAWFQFSLGAIAGAWIGGWEGVAIAIVGNGVMHLLGSLRE